MKTIQPLEVKADAKPRKEWTNCIGRVLVVRAKRLNFGNHRLGVGQIEQIYNRLNSPSVIKHKLARNTQIQ
jgi:hypothetical protein